MIRTIKFIGEENFLKICQESNLTSIEIGVIRQIIEKWDNLMAVPDFSERWQKKAEVAISKIAEFPSERREQILGALIKMNLLFVELRQKQRK